MGHCCGSGSIPGLGIFACLGHGQKKKKKKRKKFSLKKRRFGVTQNIEALLGEEEYAMGVFQKAEPGAVGRMYGKVDLDLE